jgi:4-amino-4-deoxy-L-arabinose transferase-like glycosyltransferase
MHGAIHAIRGDVYYRRIKKSVRLRRSFRNPAVTLLVLILCVGAFLRLYHLSGVPTELVADELDLYNSAYSIAATGHDVDGTLQPFLYSPFTRNPPAYAIAGYASSLVLGKNAFALRFPAALFGLISVLLLYGIALRLTHRTDIALAAALLMAIAPIFVQFSRTAWEPSSELPFLLGGLYALIVALQRGLHLRMLALAALLLAIACYTYLAGWFYAVMLAGGMIALNARSFQAEPRWKPWAKIALASALFAVLAWPALRMSFFDPSTASRTARMATFAHGITWSALQRFFENYFAHFRISYLVTTGEPKAGVTWRYLNGFGALYWFMIPLAATGLFACAAYVRERGMRWWIYWFLLVYPLGGALTNDGAPNAPRTLAGAPVFCLLAAFGLAFFADWTRGRARQATYGAFAAISLVSCALFASFYFTQYVHRNSNAWDSGSAALFASIRANGSGYQRVCFAVRPAWYETNVYARYYLSDTSLQWFTDVNAPACSMPGTLLAEDPQHFRSQRGFVQLGSVLDVDGRRFALLQGNELHAAIRDRARRGKD